MNSFCQSLSGYGDRENADVCVVRFVVQQIMTEELWSDVHFLQKLYWFLLFSSNLY
jgi:hypothetical protein